MIFGDDAGLGANRPVLDLEAQDAPVFQLELAAQKSMRLEDVRVHVGRNLAADALAEEEKIAEADLLAELRTGLAADNDRLDLGEVAFLIIGKALEELFAGDQSQDGVAEELEALVGVVPGVLRAPRTMRQRSRELGFVRERPPQPVVERREPGGGELVRV